MATASTAPDKVKVTSGDTARGYLDAKLAVGSGLSKTVVTPGGDETLRVDITTISAAQHGVQTDPSLHAVATPALNGFMSAADKAKLDALITNPVPDTRNLIAGAGLTGGGDLTADRTFNVVAADASIVVGANDVAVGVLQSDASHGARGGGTQHTVATVVLAGFMSAADKVKLDGIETGAEVDDKDVLVSANDTAPGFLLGKIVGGTGITVSELNDGGDEDLEIAFTGTTTDELVGVTAADTAPGYLEAKIVPGDGLTRTIVNPAADEDYRLDVALTADGQHGVRGGGTQHAVATGAVAGFMSAADKLKLDGIASGATVDDRRLLVSANDSTAAFLLSKLTAGAGITLTELNDGANESVEISAPGSTTDELVTVTGADTTPGTLDSKIVPGDGLTRTVLNPAADEDYQLDVALTDDSQHGARGGGTQHALATGVLHGFMDMSDFTKLAGIEAGAEVNDVFSVFGRVGAVVAVAGDYTAGEVTFVPDGDIAATDVQAAIVEVRDDTDTKLSGKVDTTTQVIAGAGLTGGGALSSDVTLNVIANADGSIVVNADDILVGVLATDAQHGVRGGGTQHAVATGATAGFMSASDKTSLDALVVTDGGQVSSLTLTGLFNTILNLNQTTGTSPVTVDLAPVVNLVSLATAYLNGPTIPVSSVPVELNNDGTSLTNMLFDDTFTTGGAFIGGGILSSGTVTYNSGTFIWALMQESKVYRAAVGPGFAAFTLFNALPAIENLGNFDLVSAIVLNVGVQHRRITSGTSVVAQTIGLSYAAQARTTVSGAVLTYSVGMTAVQFAPKFSTVAGSTVNMGTLRAVQCVEPAAALFQPSAGTENMTAYYGLDFPNMTFGGASATISVIRSQLNTGTNKRFLDHTGNAVSRLRGHLQFDVDAFGVILGASLDVLMRWQAAGHLSFFGFGPNSDLQISSPSLNRFDFDAGGAGAGRFDFTCATFFVSGGRAQFDSIVDLNMPVALGGGAAATLGTIGGSGPTTAAQAQWVQIEVNGVNHWIAAWT